MKRFSLLFAAAVFFALFSLSSGEAGSPPLPKGKTIAVLVKGTPSHAAAARSILLRGLIDGGYRAVDEKQLERIRRSKAAALALEGNVEAILKLGRTYGFSVLLSGNMTVPKPVRNEFSLFTATATFSASACYSSDGKQIFAGTESAKEIGYTPEEAGQKAAETAARALAEVILGKRTSGQPEAAGTRYTLFISPVRSFAEAHGIVESCRTAGASSASLVRLSAGRAEVEAEFQGSATQLVSSLLRARRDLAEESVEGNTIRLGKQ